MIAIILRGAAVLIALFSLLNALLVRDPAFTTLHGMCAVLGGIVAYVLARILHRSIAAWVILTIFFPFVTLLILAFMPTSKRRNLPELIDALKKTIEDNPENSAARYHLGLMYLEADNKPAATEQYELLETLKSPYGDKLLSKINKR